MLRVEIKVGKMAILEERLVVENRPPCLQGSLLIITVVKNKNKNN